MYNPPKPKGQTGERLDVSTPDDIPPDEAELAAFNPTRMRNRETQFFSIPDGSDVKSPPDLTDRLFAAMNWKRVVGVLLTCGFVIQCTTLGLSVHCEFRDSSLPLDNNTVNSPTTLQTILPTSTQTPSLDPVIPYDGQSTLTLCTDGVRFRISTRSKKVITVCTYNNEMVRIDLRLFLHGRPTGIGIYLTPSEFYALRGLYIPILDNITIQLARIRNSTRIKTSHT